MDEGLIKGIKYLNVKTRLLFVKNYQKFSPYQNFLLRACIAALYNDKQ